MRITKSLIISLMLIPLLAFAQNQVVLPRAGLTPESPFYFLDKMGEALRTFFTFNPEGKARLQITFAAERVAEIKIILETKGVEAKGLDVAQSRLQAHLTNAAAIVADQKSAGKDMSALANELDENLEPPKSVLAQSFKAQKRTLEDKEDELKAQLRAAHRAGDAAQAEAIAAELGQVKARKELLKLKEEDIEDELEVEEEKLEEGLEAQRKAEKSIREAEKEKQEVLDEAADERVDLPVNAFAEFDGFLAQAKSALQVGNFAEAVRLAKQAEKSLDRIEDITEELEKKRELEEEAEEEKEEQMKEEEEQTREEVEEEQERTQEQQERELGGAKRQREEGEEQREREEDNDRQRVDD